jgi:hypothetical protein
VTGDAVEGRGSWRKLILQHNLEGRGVGTLPMQVVGELLGRRGIHRDILNLLLPHAVSKLSFFLNILLYCYLC